ncbi:MAG: phosphoglucosamine mutase [Betaproteobacteria bacterium RIFCSPLOWO2_02_FULL_62_17]|nr:MAG: phosphoglucosamine mutase [Betaproteobacteria bacterium RIFCSPLOWO2_02_FULL_62_17]
MTRKYFGTDGIRGKVGKSPITPEFAMRMGFAAGTVLVKHAGMAKGERPAVLIGKDTRVSGYMLEAALEAGFSAAGVDVMLVGPLPTPGVAYLTRALRLQIGVVISASHNPYDDNGVKFFSAAGAKLDDEVEAEIETQLDRPMRCKDSLQLGKARRIDDAVGRYVEFCKSTFPQSLDLRGLKIVVDCAHGAAYHVAPHVFHELGAEVVSIGVSPDGYNINDRVGTTFTGTLSKAVRVQAADLGIALDGDGDRLIMIDAHGKRYDGDQLLYVIARARAAESDLQGVAGTLMTNLALELALRKMGVDFGRAKVGDRYVLEMMQQRGWTLGGENSGHIICLDKHTTGDGIISALQVLAAVRSSHSTLAALSRDLTLYPQVLFNVPAQRGFDWQRQPMIVQAVRDSERLLGEAGRVLLRSSGTEAVFRVMVEGGDRKKVNMLARRLAAVVARHA